jgi:putative membrane protein
MNLVPIANIVSALIFTVLGIIVFVMAFVVMDKITPYHLWKEIVQEHNIALAILVGAMSIGICIIIASAIH